MIVVESAGITDVGQKRKGNEDSFFFDDEMKLYVVADGMGGHQAGGAASRLVVETIRDFIKGPMGDDTGRELIDFDKTLSKEANQLNSSIHLANQVVHDAARSEVSYHGMGSTVSAVYFGDETLVVTNVGDSPVYLIRKGVIERLSVIHTLLEEFKAVAPKGAKISGEKFKHVLTRAIGTKERVQLDTSEIQPLEGDILIISSDGLTDLVSPEEILEVVNQERYDKACHTLVDMANDRGGHDNITLIVLHVVKAEADDLQPSIQKYQIKPEKEAPGGKPKIAVDYDTEDDSRRSFVHHINVDGVIIETREAFAVGQELMLTFSVLNEQISFIVTGKIEKRDPKAIHVKFEKLTQEQRTMIKSLEERITAVTGQNNQK
jgi:protein phosphatase